MNNMLIGVDISKNVFVMHGIDSRGKETLRKKASRGDFLDVLAGYPGSVVAMEACGGANHWGRELQRRGHEVRLLAPNHVKPYVRSQKNDHADAEAIAEAASRERARFVAVKDITQQDLQTLHRIRERMVKESTAQVNMLRGLLLEYGIAIPEGRTRFVNEFHQILESHSKQLTGLMYREFIELFTEYRELSRRLEQCDKKLEAIAKSHPVAKRLLTIPGIGYVTATALLTLSVDGCQKGRDFAAMLGLIPSQYSTGGKQVLGRITKRGNKYIRKLLVQGARSMLIQCHRHQTKYYSKAAELKIRLGFNKAAVATANRNARIAYRLLISDEVEFQDTVFV